MQHNLSFHTWKSQVDTKCLTIYGITPEDGGLSEGDLKNHYSPNLTPGAFIDWYGNKYNLVPVRKYSCW